MTNLLGGLFDRDARLADRAGRKDMKPIIAKSRGEHAFAGRLVVLVDSASASAAELLARAVQLQKRGVVVGDRSSGSVMEAKIFPYGGRADGLVYSFEVLSGCLISFTACDRKLTFEFLDATPSRFVQTILRSA